MAWYNTVEFYVLAGAVAAGIVALASVPARRGEGRLHLLAGDLLPGAPTQPSIDITVDDNRRVLLLRHGLPDGITDRGAVSLAVNVSGLDIIIEERLTSARAGTPVDSAFFVLDFLGPERYHVRYNSEDAGLVTAFTLNVREGIRIHRELK